MPTLYLGVDSNVLWEKLRPKLFFRNMNESQIHFARIEGVCRYFENNREWMRYDEYLKAGDPIATGMIEGACRHVVKDRMRNVRCVFASAYWEQFQEQRMRTEQNRLHPHVKLVLSTTKT